jgi:excisionase family DNA binding protein
VFTGAIPDNQSEDTMQNPLVHSIADACALSRAGRTALYQAINAGQLRAVKRGRRTLILAEDLRHWLEALPTIAVKPAKQEQGGVP